MNNYNHHTAPAQFIEANGIRFAYRSFGKKDGVAPVDDFWLDGFLTAPPASRVAGQAFLKRRDARVDNRDIIPIDDQVQPAQFAALQE